MPDETEFISKADLRELRNLFRGFLQEFAQFEIRFKDTRHELQEQARKLKDELNGLDQAMRGDIQGKPGMLHTHEDVRKTLYGENGLVGRVGMLERERLKLRAWIAGAAATGSALGGTIVGMIIYIWTKINP